MALLVCPLLLYWNGIMQSTIIISYFHTMRVYTRRVHTGPWDIVKCMHEHKIGLSSNSICVYSVLSIPADNLEAMPPSSPPIEGHARAK